MTGPDRGPRVSRAPPPARPVPYAVLADWLEGRLDPAEAALVAAEVEHGDRAVQLAVAWLRSFLDSAGAVPLHSPPPLVRQRLRQHFQRWSQARAILEQPSVLSRAELLFDSRLDRPLAQVRGTSDLATVHLAYRAERADLVVDVHRRQDGLVRLDGQVLPLDAMLSPVFEAYVIGSGAPVRSVEGDELGRFTLEPVPVEATELRVDNGELMLVVSLDLRPEPT